MQQDSVKHLANLLSTKDPLAFQQVQAVSSYVESGYTGPILSGDEIELGLLEEDADAIDAILRTRMNEAE